MQRPSFFVSNAARAPAVAVCLSIACLSIDHAKGQDHPPPLPREFRAAWIATVANIDWPSRKALPAAEQRAEMLRLLDLASDLRLNAVVLQVRPACDAIYPSDLEPWSEFLSGVQGQAPSPAYDPLAFAVDEAHRRGLQLHAWFNPYRAGHPTGRSELSSGHVSRKHPDAVVQYGDYLWLDPGSGEGADHSLAVIVDVVRRYDIDGVHFDDYFYPYPVAEVDDEGKSTGKTTPFPDDNSWKEYADQTTVSERLGRDDWRRDNVNRFIQRVSDELKREKPWVLFGVSPFGIWRPGHPEGIVGFDPYKSLYADARRWLTEGWVDYCTPQLYWPIRSSGQSYPVLQEWWARQNPHGRHLWPGLYTSRVKTDGEGWSRREILEQVRLTQEARGASGNIHFSIKALANNYDRVGDALRSGPYAKPAAIPATPWRSLGAEPPGKPVVRQVGRRLMLSPGSDTPVWQWAVQIKNRDGWATDLIPGARGAFELPGAGSPEVVAVRAIDRLGRESKVVMSSVQR